MLINTNIPTLHTRFSATRIFLAARSLCTKAFLARYSMPEAIWLQKSRHNCGIDEGTSSPGLKP